MKVCRIVFLVLVLASMLGLSAPPAGAATFTVNKTADTNDNICSFTDCSLREAIFAANQDSTADVIVIPAGYYKLSQSFSPLEISTPVTVVGGGAETTEVVGDDFGESGFGTRMLGITSDAQNVTLSGFTLRGGDAPADGAGILSAAPTLNLERIRLADNDASGFVGGGLVTTTGAVLTNVVASTITGNAASDGAGIYHSSGTLNVTASTISGNSATADGGGIRNDTSTVNLNSSTVVGNSALSDGGGIFTTGVLNVTASTISANTADFEGGGVRNVSGQATFTSSTVSGNRADSGDGGGSSNASGGTVQAVSSTFTGNSASDGGGLSNDTGTTTVTSSIVIANTASLGEDCLNVVSGGFNVTGPECISSPATGDVSPTNAAFLGPLANNGGRTETHTIAAGSPPVNNASADPACNGNTTDQRGAPRPNDACDSGAYELTFCRGVIVNVVGTSGSDNLGGTTGPDGILAQGGNDRASSGDGNDALCGGNGKDKLSGGAGNDIFDGGPGTDKCIGGPGRDRFKSCENQRP